MRLFTLQSKYQSLLHPFTLLLIPILTVSTTSFTTPVTNLIKSSLSPHWYSSNINDRSAIGPLSVTSYRGDGAGNSIRREKLLNRNGEHFKVDRTRGKVELGSTANLVTNLEDGDTASITRWLTDDRRLALSIWDEKLLTDLGNSKYRLQLLTLKFVTFKLAPSVDALMWTEKDGGSPVFRLESVAFDPNIQFLPGMSVTAKSLGIEIEVVGELRVSNDGKGLSGRFGFQTTGNLPPPMRLLPDSALKKTSSLFNKQVANFAMQSFQKGAISEYRKFRVSEEALLVQNRQ